jgi:hypothetical protein
MFFYRIFLKDDNLVTLKRANENAFNGEEDLFMMKFVKQLKEKLGDISLRHHE